MTNYNEKGRTVKKGDPVRKGEWFYLCCSEDFEQAKEDFIWKVDYMENRVFPDEVSGREELAARGL